MQRILKCRFFLLVIVIILFVSQGGFAAVNGGERLVSPELLKHARLEILWEVVLPVKTGESLEKLQIFGDSLYAVSDKNYMLCLNRDNGDRIFAQNIELGGLKIDELSFYKDRLLTVAGNQLYEIDPNTGTTHSDVQLGLFIVCPAARNESYIYLSGMDRRLHTLRVEDQVLVSSVSAGNDSMITSVFANETSVIFGTDKGDVISMSPDLTEQKWQFNASDAIAGRIVKDGMSLYFASRDMNVYRLDIVGGGRRLVWKYQADGMLKTAPVVVGDIIYQNVYKKALTAISKDKGTLLWSLPGGIGLLTQSKGKAYVIARNGTLVIMDNEKAKKLSSVNFAGVSKYAVNLADSKIYIANKAGRIACLQPVK